ncbi:MAG: MlaD family protein [Deltaproteobacteria bacterium]|jgi:paraquat-inducible protein B
MAKQANRMMIGGFVVIALIILAASLAVFGSGKFFKNTVKCVMYFEGSVQGLTVGSPVLFQGVPVGSVLSIIIEVDPSELHPRIPVVIEYDPEKFKVAGGAREWHRDPRKTIPLLIKRGLRGVLVTQSFITGQLAIEINFYPDTPIIMRGEASEYKEYIEIPTIPSTTQKLFDALAKLDLEGLQKHLEATLDGISKLANDPNLSASFKRLNETLQDARKLVKRVDRQVGPLAKNTNKAVKDLGNLARNLDGRVGDLSTSLNKTLSDARGSVSQDSPLMVDLQNTLHELSAMSRSIRQLADYLDQQPQSLIFGKKKPGGK